MKRTMKILANLFTALTVVEVTTASIFFFHQPEMPKKLKK